MSLPVRGFDALRTADGLTARNKLGIVDHPARLEAAEILINTVARAEIEQGLVPGAFDVGHLRAIHQRLFGDLYEWAGVMRGEPITLEGETFMLPETMQKSDSLARFAPASTVEARLSDLFTRLEADDYLQGLDRTDFVKKAGVGSTGQRNGSLQHIGWRLIAKGFPRPFVE
ncbi:hypothetical protein VQ044_21010, partial [Aurantimonas sp. C2-5-R2]